MMPGSPLDYAIFGLICLVLLTVPFAPAVREWLYPTDVSALPIAANYSSDIDHFAGRLQRDVAAKMGVGSPTGYEDFQFVSDWTEDMDWSKVSKRLICRSSIDSDSAIHSRFPLYVDGDIRAGIKSSFSALYVTGHIDLGSESEVHDWAHADGTLRLNTNSIALRRISAGTAIELGQEVWFERPWRYKTSCWKLCRSAQRHPANAPAFLDQGGLRTSSRKHLPGVFGGHRVSNHRRLDYRGR